MHLFKAERYFLEIKGKLSKAIYIDYCIWRIKWNSLNWLEIKQFKIRFFNLSSRINCKKIFLRFSKKFHFLNFYFYIKTNLIYVRRAFVVVLSWFRLFIVKCVVRCPSPSSKVYLVVITSLLCYGILSCATCPTYLLNVWYS